MPREIRRDAFEKAELTKMLWSQSRRMCLNINGYARSTGHCSTGSMQYYQ